MARVLVDVHPQWDTAQWGGGGHEEKDVIVFYWSGWQPDRDNYVIRGCEFVCVYVCGSSCLPLCWRVCSLEYLIWSFPLIRVLVEILR